MIAAVLGLVFGLTTKDLYTYEGSVLLTVFCLGFIFTGATATAMNLGRKYAGAASAIIGSIGFCSRDCFSDREFRKYSSDVFCRVRGRARLRSAFAAVFHH